MSLRVACVIPCFNCEKTISPVVKDCLAAVDSVYVIDDGSSDRSGRAAQAAGARVIPLTRNQGVGHALITGMQAAIQDGHDTLVTLDADGAHNPLDIPRVLAAHYENANAMTIGSRWHRSLDLSAIPSHKWWANQFVRRLVNQIAGLDLPDVASGFRVFDATFARQIQAVNGFGLLYETVFCAARQSLKIGCAEVDVRYDARQIWLTKHKEFVDFIDICAARCPQPALLDKIERIRGKVLVWEPFELILCERQPGVLLFVHPLREAGGYIFQQQHPYFCGPVHDGIVI